MGESENCSNHKTDEHTEPGLVEEHDALPLEHPEGEDGEEEQEEVDEKVGAVHQVGLRLGKVAVHFHLTILKYQTRNRKMASFK